MFTGPPATPAESAHRAVLVVHQPRPFPAIPAALASRHRREDSPGCLKGLLTAGMAVVRWVLARVRQKVAHLCRLITPVCTSCSTGSALA